ncbi:MAG: PIN/TRAM domain-containing protein [Planctomycetota bacterium]|nr:PIN/TRAM domain-containing protein [Planctomycetota bacterium]
MLLYAIRFGFLLVVLGITVSLARSLEVTNRGAAYAVSYVLVPIGAAFLLVLGDILWRRKRMQELSGLFFGLLAGLVIAFVLVQVIDLVTQAFPSLIDREALPLIKLLCGAAAVFLCVTLVLQTRDVFRFLIPYVEFSRSTKGNRPLLLDTSVIIDGRIADIVDTRTFECELIVPRFVLQELQSVADSSDKLKRNRGRRGLDVLRRMQKSPGANIRILDSYVEAVEAVSEVDAKLVALAASLDARIVTNDYNLNKVAELRGIRVLNLNDLANALKPVVLPGEPLTVKIVRAGEEPGQGVGYLDDGTMVVVEQAREKMGQAVSLAVTSVLQTSAGKMIFGRMDPGGKNSADPEAGAVDKC